MSETWPCSKSGLEPEFRVGDEDFSFSWSAMVGFARGARRAIRFRRCRSGCKLVAEVHITPKIPRWAWNGEQWSRRGHESGGSVRGEKKTQGKKEGSPRESLIRQARPTILSRRAAPLEISWGGRANSVCTFVHSAKALPFQGSQTFKTGCVRRYLVQGSRTLAGKATPWRTLVGPTCGCPPVPMTSSFGKGEDDKIQSSLLKISRGGPRYVKRWEHTHRVTSREQPHHS